jgi:hypothetical protein
MYKYNMEPVFSSHSCAHHNVYLPLADSEVLIVVDVHPLECEPPARVLVLHEKDDAKAALGNQVLKVNSLATHGPGAAAQEHRVGRAVVS